MPIFSASKKHTVLMNKQKDGQKNGAAKPFGVMGQTKVEAPLF